MGGLTAAAALASTGRRVLVLERHQKAGGLTQTFERDGFCFNVGMHCLGGFGPGQPNQRLVETLARGRLKMAQVDGAHDRVSFPRLSIAFDASTSRFGSALSKAFPEEKVGIGRYVDALNLGQATLDTLLMARCASPLMSSARTWLGNRSIERWVQRTTRQVVDECVSSAQARAVLCARWGDYGSPPGESSFALHAAITRRCMDGAWYPEGGPAVFARELGATIAAAGGEVRTGAEVAEFEVHKGHATGVRLLDGTTIASDCVVSDIGIRNTLRRVPSTEADYHWARDGYSLDPSVGSVVVYLGLEGDIAARGATPANEWIYDSWNVDDLWRDPELDERAPALFISFTSLRDPTHVPGPRQQHICELVAPVAWSVFAQWDRSNSERGMCAGTESAARSATYLAFKAMVERRLVAQFRGRFPELASCIRYVETSSPVSLASFTGAEHGAMYGLQTTPQRFLSQSLRPRTPIRGLYLAGQDVATPGVMGAAMGGMMAAASIEPGLLKLIRG